MGSAFRRLPWQLAGLASPSGNLRILHRATSSRWRTQDVPAAYHYTRRFTTPPSRRENKYDEKARRLSQKALDEHEQEVKMRQNQDRRPWHREHADEPPVKQDGDEEQPLTKGKLLTTPTRLLKLILPLPTRVGSGEEDDSIDHGRGVSTGDTIQPLALLVHPQQPLSYVERLIQAELPPLMEEGREKVPNIYFRAEDTDKNSGPRNRSPSSSNSSSDSPHVASYSGLGHEGPTRPHKDKTWVRWSGSTEMGDFIRDAARGREFVIEIEGHDSEMRVGVPSFNDRTHYMRMRLRKMSRRIDEFAKIKHECDLLAHRGAHRLAKGGLAALATWWGWVYYVTFMTDYGWDLVEPVTYLAGLATIMAGYIWFLYISRDLSYKAAMNITVSRRQNALYEARGFDLHKWEQLVQEANALRKEVKAVAVEYDVDWDETRDLGGEEVKEVLEKERRKGRRGKDADEDQDEEEDDEPEEKKGSKNGKREGKVS